MMMLDFKLFFQDDAFIHLIAAFCGVINWIAVKYPFIPIKPVTANLPLLRQNN